MAYEYDENIYPPAYLLTFRTYGTWLHGDERGSVDRKLYNKYGSPRLSERPNLVKAEMGQRKYESMILTPDMRSVVDEAVRQVCKHKGKDLYALNVRTNHVHVVLAGGWKPEPLMIALKAYSTRHLREAGLVSVGRKIWARHGSMRYLWKPRHLDLAIDYVLYGQGDEFPNFEDLVGG